MIGCCSLTILLDLQLREFQLTELFFLLLFPAFLWILYKDHKNGSFTTLDLLVVYYLCLNTLNFAFHYPATQLSEYIGVVYLGMMYFLVSNLIGRGYITMTQITKSMRYLLAITVGSGMIGFFLYQTGVTSKFVVLYDDYPYLGNVVRWCGFSWCTIYVGCIILPCFYLISQLTSQRKIFLVTLVSLLFCSFSLSKEIILFVILLFFYNLGIRRISMPSFKIILPLIFVVSVFMVTTTFFVIKPTSQKINIKIENVNQVGDKQILKTDLFEVYPTTYYYMFRNAFDMLAEHPFFGIGNGQFMEQLEIRKHSGRYPQKLTTNDTHDLYWGPAAELGLGYFIFILPLISILYFYAANISVSYEMKLALLLIVTYYIISYLIGGSRNFRHFWIFLGIINGLWVYKQNCLNLTFIKPGDY